MKTLAFILTSIGVGLLYQSIVNVPSWYLEQCDIDQSLTWREFVFDCGSTAPLELYSGEHIIKGFEEKDPSRAFAKKYKNKVLQWEGQVLRVDGDSSEI